MFSKNNLILLIFFIISCQPIELISPVEIDNKRLEKISINAKEKTVNIRYNSIFSSENIEGQLTQTPLSLIKNWINENIDYFGNQNKLVINILEASILKKEINNINAKKYEEKTIFNYEIYFLVEYELYNDSEYLLANTTVEVSRSTTSRKYISLNETDLIVNDLIYKALKDFINETQLMTKKYMSEYLQ